MILNKSPFSLCVSRRWDILPKRSGLVQLVTETEGRITWRIHTTCTNTSQNRKLWQFLSNWKPLHALASSLDGKVDTLPLQLRVQSHAVLRWDCFLIKYYFFLTRFNSFEMLVLSTWNGSKMTTYLTYYMWFLLYYNKNYNSVKCSNRIFYFLFMYYILLILLLVCGFCNYF